MIKFLIFYKIPTFHWSVDRPGSANLMNYRFVDLSENGRIYNYLGILLTDKRMTIAAMAKLPHSSDVIICISKYKVPMYIH
jgi:hypothetical protein